MGIITGANYCQLVIMFMQLERKYKKMSLFKQKISEENHILASEVDEALYSIANTRVRWLSALVTLSREDKAYLPQ